MNTKYERNQTLIRVTNLTHHAKKYTNIEFELRKIDGVDNVSKQLI